MSTNIQTMRKYSHQSKTRFNKDTTQQKALPVKGAFVAILSANEINSHKKQQQKHQTLYPFLVE